MTYGSGESQIDRCKADNCRDAMRQLARMAAATVDLESRRALEARVGREAIRLMEIEGRLAVFSDGEAYQK